MPGKTCPVSWMTSQQAECSQHRNRMTSDSASATRLPHDGFRLKFDHVATGLRDSRIAKTAPSNMCESFATRTSLVSFLVVHWAHPPTGVLKQCSNTGTTWTEPTMSWSDCRCNARHAAMHLFDGRPISTGKHQRGPVSPSSRSWCGF